MRRVSVIVDGQCVEVLCERLGEQLWYHYAGESWVFQPRAKRRNGPHSQGGISHRQVMAPMPGKVIKILVQVGDPVELGQPVIVMEAMKMEYTLEARAEGVVERLNCLPGDQVSLGLELLSVSPKE